MGFIFIFVAFVVPYLFFRFFMKLEVYLTVGLTFALMPVTNFGLVVLAPLLGVGTGFLGIVLVLGSVYVLLPIGVYLLITRAIYRLVVGKPIILGRSSNSSLDTDPSDRST